ncbi:MAG: glucuronate isomerase [Clostridia bacterium]|nr:glucuronate isomerase [Clostridia bacterium]
MPSFRKDNLLLIHRKGYLDYIKTLSNVSQIEISDLETLKRAVLHYDDIILFTYCCISSLELRA